MSFTVSDGSSTCRTCDFAIKNCAVCGNNPNSCLRCQAGLYRFSSLGDDQYDQCVPCNSPEQFIDVTNTTGEGICKRCDSALPRCAVCNGNKTQCSSCNPGLARYDSNLDGVYWNCVNCPSNLFYVQDGTCFRCFTQSENPGCLECSDKSTCNKCRQGYELASNNTCVISHAPEVIDVKLNTGAGALASFASFVILFAVTSLIALI